MSQSALNDDQLQEALSLYELHGSELRAAEALGISRSAMSNRLRVARAKNAQNRMKDSGTRPIDPDTPEGFEVRQISTGYDAAGNITGQWVGSRLEGVHGETVPEGHIVKGLSTLVDEQGKTRAQWIKTTLDTSKAKTALEAAIEAALEPLEPYPVVPAPQQHLDADLLTLYTMTDCHVGMLAWGLETGVPWDLDIAERCLTEALFQVIDTAPASAIGLLNELGDFVHFDSMKPVTAEHGNILDADSRYQKVVKVVIRILRRVIFHMLTKHNEVWVLLNEGNHDPAGSVWLREMFSILFEDNPRVIVETSPVPYIAKEWGCNMLGFHHGHLSKKDSLPQLFAAMFAEMWGRTTNRHVHTGHLHHVHEIEHPGITVLQHPTLAAPDAYAIRGGWLSKRQAMSITYHRAKGQVGRGYVIP